MEIQGSVYYAEPALRSFSEVVASKTRGVMLLRFYDFKQPGSVRRTCKRCGSWCRLLMPKYSVVSSNQFKSC